LPRAESLLARLHQTAEAAGRWGSVIEILALRALALQAQGNLAQAMTSLERALRLAEPEGYVRLFVDEGTPMAALLRRAVAQGIKLNYVNRLLAALREAAQLATIQPLAEPLTRRELQVLRLLATDLSNQEIAETLVIAMGTIKTHIRNIYGKLDVHSRIQAIHRARDLTLL